VRLLVPPKEPLTFSEVLRLFYGSRRVLSPEAASGHTAFTLTGTTEGSRDLSTLTLSVRVGLRAVDPKSKIEDLKMYFNSLFASIKDFGVGGCTYFTIRFSDELFTTSRGSVGSVLVVTLEVEVDPNLPMEWEDFGLPVNIFEHSAFSVDMGMVVGIQNHRTL